MLGLQQYFEYMRIYLSQLQNMQEMSKRLKNFLEEEWLFTKQQGAHIRCGEAAGGRRFWYNSKHIPQITSCHCFESNCLLC